jgi:hypothetical protein
MPILHLKAIMEITGGAVPEDVLQSLNIDEWVYPGLGEVAASGTLTLNFGSLTTANFIFIRCNRTFTYDISAVGASQAFSANGVVILLGCAETSLAVVNTDGSNSADVEVLLGGT